jgi:LmbE family N-acetylglucosaminyl deacetylase
MNRVYFVVSTTIDTPKEWRQPVVVTFSPDGAYGHADHIAISQFTHAAAVCAADADYVDPGNARPHRVSKFYYMVNSESLGTSQPHARQLPRCPPARQ